MSRHADSPYLLPTAAAAPGDHGAGAPSRHERRWSRAFPSGGRCRCLVALVARSRAFVIWMYRRDAAELPRGVGAVLAGLRSARSPLAAAVPRLRAHGRARGALSLAGRRARRHEPA
jgi:hypothetical protein